MVRQFRKKSRRKKQQKGGNRRSRKKRRNRRSRKKRRNRRSRKKRRNRHSKRRNRRTRIKRGGAKNMLELAVSKHPDDKYYCGGKNLPRYNGGDNWTANPDSKCKPGSQCPWCAWFTLQATDPNYFYAGNDDPEAPKKPPAGLKPDGGWEHDAPSEAAIANDPHYTVVDKLI